MLTDDITLLVQAIERMLVKYDIHLNTDRFNGLRDYITSLVADIKENGE